MNRRRTKVKRSPFGKTIEGYLRDHKKKHGKITGHDLKTSFKGLNGPQRERIARHLLQADEYLKYRDINLACRITIPLYDLKTAKVAARELGKLSRNLRQLANDKTREKFHRVLGCQKEIMLTSNIIKMATDYNYMAGRVDQLFSYASDAPGQSEIPKRARQHRWWADQ